MMSLMCLESCPLFGPTLCPRLNPDRYNGNFLWALVGGCHGAAMAVAMAAALFAVASKAELRFIAIESFVLSAVTATIPPCIFLAEGYHDTKIYIIYILHMAAMSDSVSVAACKV